jgi:hypothetical protein
MFETFLCLKVAKSALTNEVGRDLTYTDCWQQLSADQFTGWDLLKELGGKQREAKMTKGRASTT